MLPPLKVGAVIYDPKVSVIWEIIRDFFESQGCPMDVAFYSTYELQVQALLDGDIDIAWNSPLAWLDAARQSGGRCRAIAMRDTDRDRVSHIVAEAAARWASPTCAATSSRSALATHRRPRSSHSVCSGTTGSAPGNDVTIRRFDVLVGKHGDHVGGELEAFRCLQRGEAAASAMLDLNWEAWTRDGTIDPSEFRILASTNRFDHCVFTVRADLETERERQLARRAVLDELRGPDTPRDDGPRGAEGVAARPHHGFRLAERGRRAGRVLQSEPSRR